MTKKYFKVYETEDYIQIVALQNHGFTYLHVYIDDQYVFTYRDCQEVNIPKRCIPKGAHFLHLNGILSFENMPFFQSYMIEIEKRTDQFVTKRSQDFQPGDILIACDNVMSVPTGYVGHSALVIDREDILESVMRFPSISIDTIDSFFKDHTLYAHYRPKNPEHGKAAVEWGLDYYRKYIKNVNKEIYKPKFTFVPSIRPKDIWDTIYCSKLIWFCYYYGANYEIKYRGPWISPRNLDEVLTKDPNFKLIYKHPDFSFKINVLKDQTVNKIKGQFLYSNASFDLWQNGVTRLF